MTGWISPGEEALSPGVPQPWPQASWSSSLDGTAPKIKRGFWGGSLPRAAGMPNPPAERGPPATAAALTLPRGRSIWQRRAAPGEARAGPSAGGTDPGTRGTAGAGMLCPGRGPGERGPP